jgi:hypothetical protein
MVSKQQLTRSHRPSTICYRIKYHYKSQTSTLDGFA